MHIYSILKHETFLRWSLNGALAHRISQTSKQIAFGASLQCSRNVNLVRLVFCVELVGTAYTNLPNRIKSARTQDCM